MPTFAYPGAPYGWRARIALLQPTMVSDTNPYEFYLMAPDGVQMVLTSLGIKGEGSRLDEYRRAIEQIDQPLKRVLARGVDAIIQTGVPPVVSRGWGFNEELLARVAAITPVPFASDITCCIDGMKALGVGKVAVLAGASMLEGMEDYFSKAGLDLVGTSTERPHGLDDVSADSLAVAFRGTVNLHRACPQAEAIYIPGANRPTVGMIAAAEEAIGIPVVTSAQACMWRGLQLAGVNTRTVAGYGRLFGV